MATPKRLYEVVTGDETNLTNLIQKLIDNIQFGRLKINHQLKANEQSASAINSSHIFFQEVAVLPQCFLKNKKQLLPPGKQNCLPTVIKKSEEKQPQTGTSGILHHHNTSTHSVS